jgi:hypothetical protein
LETTETIKKLKDSFTDVTQFSGEAHLWFDSVTFYKDVLEGEGDLGVNMHRNLTAFIKATDPQDRTLYKNRLSPIFWELHKQIMLKVIDDDLPLPKKLFLRYGALLPQLLSAEHRQAISSIFMDNRVDEAVWYCDEWVAMVANGEVSPLATDEAPVKKSDDSSALVAKLKIQVEKYQGKNDALLITLQNSQTERISLQEQLAGASNALVARHPSSSIAGIDEPYNESQRARINEIPNILKNISVLGKNIASSYQEYSENITHINGLKRDLAGASNGAPIADRSIINQEAGQLQSLARMSVGRQGNHFPILAGQFFSSELRFVATRENVVKLLAEIEEVDVNVFKREFRRQVNRVPPHVILVPCYGSMGVCWEPYERHNKATSRGRIAVPMFPSDLKKAVITAVGMLRWETAKEMAAHYWMEEGITGQYYQYFTEAKLKGDLRSAFIADYLLWVTAESEGMQKMEREVRGVFWRNIPFSEERREKLRKRGFVYDELFKKDINRQNSSGY